MVAKQKLTSVYRNGFRAVSTKMTAKPTFQEYHLWLKQAHDIEINEPRYKTYYELNSTQLLNEAQGHKFFSASESAITNAIQQYDTTGKYQLLMGKQELNLSKKPFDSVINKSYRQNVAFNKRFPSAPKEGWVLPNNWFSKIDDVLRTTIVTKYIDGPKFLADALSIHSKKCGLDSLYSSREGDAGYYAYHFYLKMPVQIANLDMSSSSINFSVEIQLTTQLQEVLRQLTHSFYEELRLDPEQDKSAWKWNFGSSRFQASYLGHTLHLLEGVIVQLKDQAPQTEPKRDPKNDG